MNRNIKFTYATIDHFSESKTFKTLEGARAYLRRRLGDSYDVSLMGYAVAFDGVGKVTLRGGATWKELLGSDPFPQEDSVYDYTDSGDRELPDWADPAWVAREKADDEWPSE